MDKSDLSHERSGSNYFEMEESSSTVKQLSILDQVDMHVEAIQSLVKSQRKSLQVQGSVEDDIWASGNFSYISDIRYHAEKILKVLPEGQNSLPSAFPPQNISNQPENASVDVITVCEKALKNSLVLRTIMKHLDAPNLLRCRLVSKVWDEEATIQLLSRKWNYISFGWEDTQKYEREEGGTLEEFTEICRGDPRRKFPCSEFSFFLCGDDTFSGVAKPELSNFLSNYGHHIKKLNLSSSYNSTPTLRILSKIIFDWTPNVKSLTLSFPFYEEEDDDVDDDLPPQDRAILMPPTSSLQQLQELTLQTYSESESGIVLERLKRFVKQILAAAPNLKKISDSEMCFVTEIISSGKIKAVDSHCVSASRLKVPRCVEFSRARPQLSSLWVELQEFVKGEEVRARDIFSSLQLILESSRLTLKNLHLSQRLHFDLAFYRSMNMVGEYRQARVAIPVMENLQSLTMFLWTPFRNGGGWILPRGSSFQVSFPRLKFLNFSLMRNGEQGYPHGHTDNPFSNHFNSSTTVETLTIEPDYGSFLSPEWITQTRDLYPNVRTLYLDVGKNSMELPKICGNIWKSWNTSALETLSIKIGCSDLGRGQRGNFSELMDQALTGFDQHTCRKLREQPLSDNNAGDQGLERNSSILDMSKLKLFKLSGDSSSGFPIFSRVSVIHAFEPMRRRQNLQVVIHGTKLEEMVHPSNLDFWVSKENERY